MNAAVCVDFQRGQGNLNGSKGNSSNEDKEATKDIVDDFNSALSERPLHHWRLLRNFHALSSNMGQGHPT